MEYKVKKRGRLEGWRTAMRQSLEEISESLQGISDSQIRKAIRDCRGGKHNGCIKPGEGRETSKDEP